MSLYDSTVDMLSLLSEEDLQAVNFVVSRFVVKSEKDEGESAFFKPKTKAEVMKILDIAEEQFANGEYEDSETMEKELAEEFGLKA